MEDKQTKFQRIAARRTSEVIRKLDYLSRCADKEEYDYTAKEVTSMFDAIEEALEDARAQFGTQLLFSFDGAPQKTELSERGGI